MKLSLKHHTSKFQLGTEMWNVALWTDQSGRRWNSFENGVKVTRNHYKLLKCQRVWTKWEVEFNSVFAKLSSYVSQKLFSLNIHHIEKIFPVKFIDVNVISRHVQFCVGWEGF